MKNQEIEVTTTLEVDEIQRALQPVFAGATFDSLRSDSGGFLDAAADQPDLSFVAHRKTLTQMWCVQVRVYDLGAERGAVFTAMGSSLYEHFGAGSPRNTISLSKSLKVADEAARSIRSARRPVVLPDTPALLRDDPVPAPAPAPARATAPAVVPASPPPPGGKISYVRRSR